MYLRNKLKIKYFYLSPFILVLLVLNIFPINNIYRKRESIYTISEKIETLVQTEENFNKSYEIIKDNFKLTLKFSQLILHYDSKNMEEAFFSFIKPVFNFILTITIEDILNGRNSPSNTVSILFNNKMKLNYNNIQASLSSEYLQFEKLEDNTFNYSFYYGEKNIETNIDFSKYLKSDSQNYYIKKFENELNNLLFDSVCDIFKSILDKYPVSDLLFLYQTIVNWILYTNSFKIELDWGNNLEKVFVYQFLEEKHEKESLTFMKFEKIHVVLELLYTKGKKTFKNIIVDQLTLSKTLFDFYIKDDAYIDNFEVKTILTKLFRKATNILFPFEY